MTNQQHPITPPSQELVRKWIEDWAGGQMKGPVTTDQLEIAFRAAQWGADLELDACCEYLLDTHVSAYANALRAARRPKPPSLAEEALKRAAMLEELARSCGHDSDDTIRRALERLQELEGGQ